MGAGYLTDYSSKVDKVSQGVDLVLVDTGEQESETLAANQIGNATSTARPLGEFGGVQTNKTFIYNGQNWEPRAELKVARDRPACSIVQGEDRQVNIHKAP